MKTKNKFFILVLVSILILVSSVQALDSNETSIALEEITSKIAEANSSGLPTSRFSSLLSTIEQLFEAQLSLEQTKGISDYTVIENQINELSSLLDQQKNQNDELSVLQQKALELGEDTSSYSKYLEAKKEFIKERYENVPALVEETYDLISEEQALQTRVRTIYSSSANSIIRFFKNNAIQLSILLVVLLLLYFTTHKRIKTYFINRKIRDLQLERTILQNMIKRSQDEYFHAFSIPEELYYIRIEKFGDLIRDIERQIPLLTEEKQKVKGLAPIKPIAKVEAPAHVHYGINGSTLLLLLKNLFSYSKIKFIIHETSRAIKERKERKRIRKRREELVEQREKEHKKKVSEIISIKAKRERALSSVKRREKAILLQRSLSGKINNIYNKILIFLGIKKTLKISEKGKQKIQTLKEKPITKEENC